MDKRAKTIIGISVISILVILVIIFTVFIINKIKGQEKIDTVVENLEQENVQEKIEEKIDDEQKIDVEDLFLDVDGKNAIGVIKIAKIDFEGLIYDGTSLDNLAKGVGHFDNSPYLDGNVCLAAHNTNKFWAKLNTLEVGDQITYISFLGTRQYQVATIEEIQETDWTKLENTEGNMLTLITCVKGKPELRLCVQAIQA